MFFPSNRCWRTTAWKKTVQLFVVQSDLLERLMLDIIIIINLFNYLIDAISIILLRRMCWLLPGKMCYLAYRYLLMYFLVLMYRLRPGTGTALQQKNDQSNQRRRTSKTL